MFRLIFILYFGLMTFYGPLTFASSCEMIYIWNEMMPMSELGLPEIQEHATSNHYFLFTLNPLHKLDPQSFLLKQKLSELGLLNHFPAYVLINSKNEIVPLRLGYIFSMDLSHFINQELFQKECVK